MLAERYPYYLAGSPEDSTDVLAVTDKYTDEVVTHVALADGAAIERAIVAAERATRPMAQLPAYARREILAHCASRFTERADELAEALCIEAGKPIRDSRGEVARLVETFRIASEEAGRTYGEVLPMDLSARAVAYTGMWKRVPVGPCSFITPFNFPLNLVAHKVAPAIAAGCPFVLKPSSLTPVGALIIGEVLAETDLPEGAFSILPCRLADAGPFSTDERLKLLSFTGSPKVGWQLKREAGKKRVALELGGNAAVVVDHDADLDDVVERIRMGAFYQSGQSCISVQRILIHASIYDELKARLVADARSLQVGNPRDEGTFIGPIISDDEAARIEEWIRAAVAVGATLLCGGQRNGKMIEPTLLESVPKDALLYAAEAFGPVATLEPFATFDEAIRIVNDSRYGLQAGLFVRDIAKIQKAWDELEVGGVIIGDVPSWRVDHMPYGGVKDSGLGREGIRFAIDELTEIRLLAIRNVPQKPH
ncbi:MAG: aldehyde dehydrogenase family protein [Polyangiales bacterium]